MQSLWSGLLPLILFFSFYKFYNLYAATAVLLLVTLVIVSLHYWRYRKLEYWQLISSGVVVLMAAATLALRDPWFIKLKPTVVYWLLAASFGFCRYVLHCPTIVEKMLKQWPDVIDSPTILKYLNYLWTISFGMLGLVNGLIAYTCNTNIWVNFKLFGALGWLLLTSCLQAMILSRHTKMSETNDNYKSKK